MPSPRDLVLGYIDDQAQLGSRVQPTEVLDVLRTLDDHPRDEMELKLMAVAILDELLTEGSITGYHAPREPDQGTDGPNLDVLEFTITPRGAIDD